MKKLIFLCSLFFTGQLSFGQVTVGTKTLILPLNTSKQATKLVRLEVDNGRPVILRFEGLNPLRYRYALNHELVSLFNKGSVDIRKLVSKVKVDPTVGSDAAILDEKSKQLQGLENAKNSNFLILNDSITALIDAKIETLQQEIIESGQKSIQSIEQSENVKLNFEAMDIISVKTESVEDLKNYAINRYMELVRLSAKLKDQLVLLVSTNKSKDQIDLDILQKEAREASLNASDLVDYFNLVSGKIGDFDNEDIKRQKKEFLDNIEVIEKNLALIFSLQSSIQTLPLDHQGENFDFIKVQLEVIPQDGSFTPTLKIQNYDYKIWIKGGVKIDFSAGLFISSLRDNSYLALEQDASDDNVPSMYKIIREDKGNYEFGIGSMVNVTYRSARTMNIGVGVGGYITTNQKFRFTAGPTLGIGKMERVIFSFGLVLGEVTDISSKVNLTDNFELGTDGAIPTVQKFDFGHYFSFTYNLGKAKAKE